jgi:hypothetical protein
VVVVVRLRCGALFVVAGIGFAVTGGNTVGDSLTVAIATTRLAVVHL